MGKLWKGNVEMTLSSFKMNKKNALHLAYGFYLLFICRSSMGLEALPWLSLSVSATFPPTSWVLKRPEVGVLSFEPGCCDGGKQHDIEVGGGTS